MLHLRIITPPDRTATVLQEPAKDPGVTHITARPVSGSASGQRRGRRRSGGADHGAVPSPPTRPWCASATGPRLSSGPARRSSSTGPASGSAARSPARSTCAPPPSRRPTLIGLCAALERGGSVGVRPPAGLPDAGRPRHPRSTADAAWASARSPPPCHPTSGFGRRSDAKPARDLVTAGSAPLRALISLG